MSLIKFDDFCLCFVYYISLLISLACFNSCTLMYTDSMELSFCVHCNHAILDTTFCPHCNSTQPTKGTIRSTGILMTAFLGLGVMACGDESTVEEPNDAQPEVALVDNANIDKGDKGEKGENSAPEKSDATDPEKDTDAVAEKDSEKDAPTPLHEIIGSTGVDEPSDILWGHDIEKDSEDLEEILKEKQPAEAAPVKVPDGGLTGLTMDRPGRPVGAKYGIPSVSNGVGGPPRGPKGRVRIGAVSTDDCDSTHTQKIFRKYSSQLRTCYDFQLKQAPTLETTIDVEIDISKGSVSAVSIERNEATGDASGSEPLGQCVQKRMKRWKFPQDCTGTVQGTFSFKTKK